MVLITTCDESELPPTLQTSGKCVIVAEGEFRRSICETDEYRLALYFVGRRSFEFLSPFLRKFAV